MKNVFITIIFVVLTAFCMYAQNGVSINTTGAAADQSAMLDVSSNTKGFLTPRMTMQERIDIITPARGLLVYQIDNDFGFWFFDGFNWLKANAGDNLGNHIATDSLDMSNNKIINLATCTHNLDAANKEYVDNAVAAGGGGNSKPSMLSSESTLDYTLSEAVQYCENLNEGGFTDWSLPTFDEIAYFFGSDPSTNYLWTKSMASGKENPVNQHYVSARLSDGKFRNGEEYAEPIFKRISSSTSNTTWTTFGSITPSSVGNWLSITQIKLEGYRYSSATCYLRIKFNYSNGSYGYSPEFSTTASSYETLIDWVNIQSPLSLLSLELEGRQSNSSYYAYGRLLISGYEITPHQKDGNKLYCRCVR